MTTCIPWAAGVPAAGGAPRWWEPVVPPGPDFNKRIDDPRWQGSFATTPLESGNGSAAETVMFRALHDSDANGRYLYLSWWVQVDPVLSNNTDRITVGFQTETGEAYVVRLPGFTSVPPAGTPTEAGASPGATAYTAAAGGSSGPWSLAQLPNTPNWIPTYERSWIDSSTNAWAVNLRVPLFVAAASPAGAMDDTGIDVGDDFRLWFEVKVTTTAVGSFFHNWPRPTDLSGLTTVPNPDTWAPVRTGGGPEDATCAAGIWIDVANVGTTNTDSMGNPTPNVIKWDKNSPVVNTFFAKPMNNTGGAINASALHARFRLANWGSQPDWNAVADPATLWSDILPGLDDVQGPNVNVANGSRAELTKGWTMTTTSKPNINEFDPPGPTKKRSHQCMLVELSGAGFDFGRSSVYRNMDVVKASEFERDATISVKGLGQLGSAPDRNVYLYVQSLNMPRDVDPRDPPPSPEPSDLGLSVLGKQDEEPTAWQIAERVPTQMVHVFTETGETYEEDDGTQRPVLRPQTSFGVFVQHDGPLHGWDQSLEGALQELAPNFYKLRVPYDGEVTVTQKVKAYEQPRRRPGCFPWIVALILAIIAFFRKLVKH